VVARKLLHPFYIHLPPILHWQWLAINLLVSQDNFKAVKFFQKACDLNSGGGCYFLGFMYEKGK
jgi:TPR repeat protein